MKLRSLSLLLCLLVTTTLFAQRVDSLLGVLDTTRNERKVKTLNELFRATLQSDPIKAVGYTREALNLATDIKDQKGMAASYNNLGIAYKNQGAFDKSLDYYMTSLKTYEELQNKEGIATTKNNISNIYAIKKDYAQAMKYLEESYHLFLELDDQDRMIGSMNNLGNLNIEMQQYEKAMNYFSDAYQLAEKRGEKYADPLINMGNIYFKQGNFDNAIEHYEKALAIERANNNKLNVLNIVTNLGIALAKGKQPKPAKIYLDEATSLCAELQAYSFLPAIYKGVAENFANVGDWKQAYETQVKYDEARERIYGEESSRNIAQMEMIVGFQQKEKELDILKKDDEITKLELQKSRLFIVLVILGILSILGGLNFFYLSKRKVFKKKVSKG
ncbi:MAG TPA: tetratricopeptide repeat protein [Chryseolinea sp.]|nr:tetratricopeptide repeat protein [Chryseolinea sp.]